MSSRVISKYSWDNETIRLVEYDGPGEDAHVRLELSQQRPACEISLEVEDARHLPALIDRARERRTIFYGSLKEQRRQLEPGDKGFPVIFQIHKNDIIVRSHSTPVLLIVRLAFFINGLELALEAYEADQATQESRVAMSAGAALEGFREMAAASEGPAAAQ